MAAANLGVFIALMHWDVPGFGDWNSVIGSLTRSYPAGLALILVGIINAQLSADAKARVIFTRWRDPLPGSRAFSIYMHRDPRTDVAHLSALFAPFPTDPKQQNARWYALYKSVDKDPSVVQVHREFLFARDYGCLALLMLLALAPLAFVATPSRTIAIAYSVALLVQFLLVSRAARHHGERFVTTVLALKAAGR